MYVTPASARAPPALAPPAPAPLPAPELEDAADGTRVFEEGALARVGTGREVMLQG
jgi:hypothetical protein